MKIWNSYGSEHSANLVLIGHFKDVGSAEVTKEMIDELTEFFRTGENEPQADRYSEKAIELLKRLNFYGASPGDMDQFRYDFSIKLEGSKIIVTSDDEITALVKLFVEKGARVELFSAHDYPDTGQGRGQ